jgi:hypothetical protein
VSVALFVVAASIVFAELRTPDVWDPLGDYPVQTVADSDHSLRVDGLITVDAVKCADEQVHVRGVLSWQAMDPPGSVIETGSGTSVRAEGCETFTFQNPIPREVRDVIEAQHANGIAAPVWRITGTETPFDADRTGVARTWVTENFVVVP